MSSDKTEQILARLRERAARQKQEPPYLIDQALRERLRQKTPEGPLSQVRPPERHSAVFREQLKAFLDSHPEVEPALDTTETAAEASTAAAPSWHQRWQAMVSASRELFARPAYMPALATLAVVAVVVVLVMQYRTPSPFESALAKLTPPTTTDAALIDTLATVPDGFANYGLGTRSAIDEPAILGSRLGLEIGELQLLTRLAPDRVTAEHLEALSTLAGELSDGETLAASVRDLQPGALDGEAWNRFIKQLDRHAQQADLQIPLAFGVWLAELRIAQADDGDLNELLGRVGDFTDYFRQRELPAIQQLINRATALANQPSVSARELQTLQRLEEQVIRMEMGN